MLLTLLPVAVQAQVAVGGWTLYSAFNTVEKIIETDTYAYYMSSGSLYRVDKDTYEVNTLNVANKLNDSNITGIYPATDGKSVVVAYESGNIDRLYDDGKIVNMSDIKDAIMSKSRKINDVAFGKNNFYVATDFGLVTFDNKKNEVRETAYTELPLQLVAAMGDIVSVLCDNVLYFGRQTDKITNFNQLKKASNYGNRNSFRSMKGLGENMILLAHASDNGSLYLMTVDIDKLTVSNQHISSAAGSGYVKNLTLSVRNHKNGVYAVNNEGIYSYDKDGNQTFIAGVKEGNGSFVSYYDDARRMWIGSAEGMRYMDVSNPAEMAVIENVVTGSGLTTNEIHSIHIGKSGKVYVQNLVEMLPFNITENSRLVSAVNVIDNGKIRDVSAKDVQKENKNSPNLKPLPVIGPYQICEDPDDADAYYIGSMFEGLYRIKDGKQTHKYYIDNSGFCADIYGWSARALCPIVDKSGNLWVYIPTSEGEETAKVYILSKEKRTSTEVTPADWKKVVPAFPDAKRGVLGLACEQSDMVVIAQGFWSNSIGWFNSKGTSSLNDDTQLITTRYIDQDNKDLDFSHITALAEDKNGRIWVGTEKGVFEIIDPTKLTNSTAIVNHLKVPRNDGTNLADYLLDSQIVSQIAVDASNRKWISTIGSGVYLVSENGDEILEHYTTDNSILPSNTVYAVGCDPNSNKVYFGTGQGLVEYNSTSAPGKENYNEVYAYPNPVKPDFTGWITVTGLMEDSLVKITDSAGNVIVQGRSDGSMFVWDGCNRSGERVKSGVYYVMASQNATGSSSACVTKIMVIN